MIVLLLKDAGISTFCKQHKTTTRIRFSQSIINLPYIWHVYLILMPFCQRGVNYHRLTSGMHRTVGFTTRAYHAFSFLYCQFIENGVKIGLSYIYNLLTVVGASPHIGSHVTVAVINQN